MEYILSQEEFNELVPKKELIDVKEQLNAVVEIFRNTDLCAQHRFNSPNIYCDNCPIASLNLTKPQGKYWKPCPYQHFSK